MRGGYVHNRVLIEPIERAARRLGCEVDREVPIGREGRVLYGDLLIRQASTRILVEVEMSSRRIPNDLSKVAALEVCDLWIVVPNSRVAGSVRRKLSRQGTQPRPGLFVLLLPQALQRLEELFALNSGSNAVSEKEKRKRVGR